MDQQSVTELPVESSWFQRHRKWAISLGVVGGLSALACFVGAILLLVLAIFRGSDAYAQAIAQARSSPSVIHELGEPIQPGWWLIGSININGPAGSAEFETPLRGPSGRGTLYVTAEKRAGQWQYKVLEVAVEGKNERINLLADRDGV